MRAACRASLSVFLLTVICSTLAQADVDIVINGVTAPLEANIRSYLSLTRYAKRTDLDTATLERLQARIPTEVRKALQPLGYYAADATTTVTQKKAGWRIEITVTPNRATRVSEVTLNITGAGANDPLLTAIRERHDLRPGQRLNHGTYDAIKAELLLTATNQGYLDAHWLRSELEINRAERRAYIVLELATGPRYRVGVISIEQSVIADTKVRRLLRIHEGDPFTIEALLQSQYVLDDSQYFSQADINPGTRDPATLTVPIQVRAQPNAKNSYAISAGYGTNTKARGKLTWENRLLNSYGHRTKLELTGSAVGYEAALRYSIPVMDIALEKLEFGYSIKKEELADATSYRDEFSAGLTEVMGSWQRVLFVRISNEASRYPDRTEHSYLIIPGVSFATLPTHLFGQDRHYALFTELTGSPSSLGSGASYLRLLINGERIFNLREHWYLRLRGQVGASSVNRFSELPASQRFFAGGDNSVRGFSLNELSPVDTQGNRVGARNLLVGTAEIERDLPRNFRLATFYDIGNAIDHFNDPLEYSAGLGLRWHIAVASLGLDIAKPLSQPQRAWRLHLHISTLF